MDTFVQATDGKFHQNPVWRGKTWTIAVFDGIPGIEISVNRNSTQKSARSRANSVLRTMQFPAKLKKVEGIKTQTLLDGKFKPVMCFDIQINDPPPPPDSEDGVVNSVDVDHQFIAWYLEFEESTIIDALAGTLFPPILYKFLFNKSVMLEEMLPQLKRWAKRRARDVEYLTNGKVRIRK